MSIKKVKCKELDSVCFRSLSDYFLKLTKTRKTTYEFTDKEINERHLKKILEAGQWTPSCTNLQPWHFIIVKNKERIKKLMMTANYGDFHSDPTLIIALVLLVDRCPGNGLSCFRGKYSGVYDTFMSIGMAGLNMVLEAWDNNINSCIVTPQQDDARKILKVRNQDYVPLLLGFGYQNKNAFQKKRERSPLDCITSYEFFGGKR